MPFLLCLPHLRPSLLPKLQSFCLFVVHLNQTVGMTPQMNLVWHLAMPQRVLELHLPSSLLPFSIGVSLPFSAYSFFKRLYSRIVAGLFRSSVGPSIGKFAGGLTHRFIFSYVSIKVMLKNLRITYSSIICPSQQIATNSRMLDAFLTSSQTGWDGIISARASKCSHRGISSCLRASSSCCVWIVLLSAC